MYVKTEAIERIAAKKVSHINPLGEMALARWGSHGEVIGRGLMADGGSCIFKGNLQQKGAGGAELVPKEVIISPLLRPRTDEHELVVGFEDPTPLDAPFNPFEIGKKGILMTEAYAPSNAPGAIHTNLIYLGAETHKVLTVLTPLQAMECGLSTHYRQINMVKEAEIFSLGPCTSFLIEIGADEHSRIALMELDRNGVVDAVVPFMDPRPGVWYSDHISPASMPVQAGRDGSMYVLVNGRDADTWRVGFVRVIGTHIVEIGKKPFLEPVEADGHGPGGQKIAFASYYDVGKGELYYHINDRECARCKLLVG